MTTQKTEALPLIHLLHKPTGPSSSHILSPYRRDRSVLKVGHCGTLDPLASGLVLVLLNRATGLAQYLSTETKKEYILSISFGEERTTDDAEGEITQRSTTYPSKDHIIDTIPQFLGKIQQKPPIFSAVHINGKRSYKLARSGITPQHKARDVIIDTIDLLEYDKHVSRFRISCHSGTYMRSLARDFGHAVGSCAFASAIHRSKIGPFECPKSPEDIVEISPIESLQGTNLARYMLSPQESQKIIETGSLSTAITTWKDLKPYTQLIDPQQTNPLRQLIAIVGQNGRLACRLILS